VVVSLLTSLWKSGKTTLLSVLLSRLKTGGELAGLPVRAGRAVVVSEEPPELWWERGRHLDLDDHIQWFCKPYQGKPTTEQWHDLLAQVGRMHDRQPVDLLAPNVCQPAARPLRHLLAPPDTPAREKVPSPQAWGLHPGKSAIRFRGIGRNHYQKRRHRV
jgi:hypothetical protein